jgi:hypothetical protein
MQMACNIDCLRSATAQGGRPDRAGLAVRPQDVVENCENSGAHPPMACMVRCGFPSRLERGAERGQIGDRLGAGVDGLHAGGEVARPRRDLPATLHLK